MTTRPSASREAVRFGGVASRTTGFAGLLTALPTWLATVTM